MDVKDFYYDLPGADRAGSAGRSFFFPALVLDKKTGEMAQGV